MNFLFNKTLLKQQIKNLNLKRNLSSAYSDNDLKIDYLKRTFVFYDKPNHYEYLVSKNPNIAKLRRSSVLVPISLKHERNTKKNYIQVPSFTLTKRTETMRTFSGEVCFVGGRADEKDKDEIATALREAKEEINLGSERLIVLAKLCPVVTSKGDLVTPVVAYFDDDDFKPVINEHEVELVFSLPTERFLFSERYTRKSIKNTTDEYYLHFFKDVVNGKPIETWGLTALLCIVISSMLHSRPPSFEVDPTHPLSNENTIDYLDDYLLNKSKRLIDYHAKRQTKSK